MTEKKNESQPQQFLGPVIAASIVEKAVGMVLERIAKNPKLSLEKKDVPAVKKQVSEKVADEINARVEHVTNTEPAIQSRVMQGSFGAVMLAVAGIVQLWFDGVPNTPADYVPHAGVIASAAWIIYGRIRAKKPVGK